MSLDKKNILNFKSMIEKEYPIFIKDIYFYNFKLEMIYDNIEKKTKFCESEEQNLIFLHNLVDEENSALFLEELIKHNFLVIIVTKDFKILYSNTKNPIQIRRWKIENEKWNIDYLKCFDEGEEELKSFYNTRWFISCDWDFEDFGNKFLFILNMIPKNPKNIPKNIATFKKFFELKKPSPENIKLEFE